MEHEVIDLLIYSQTRVYFGPIYREPDLAVKFEGNVN